MWDSTGLLIPASLSLNPTCCLELQQKFCWKERKWQHSWCTPSPGEETREEAAGSSYLIM